MSLIPIEHPRRLRSAAEGEAWFRGLGQDRVSVSGLQTSNPERIARVVAAVEPKHDHTVSFLGGTLGTAAHDLLDTLALSSFQYLDVRTVDADLRIWPALRSWVHVYTERPEGAARPETVDLPIPVALAIFRAKSGERLDRGFVNGLHEETKPLLVRFLVELATKVDAVLDVELATARALTELYAGEKLDWQADGFLLDFPEGRIHGYLPTPRITESDRAKWQARATKGLVRAGLSIA
ncbi:MAG: hypothetical protein JWP87_5456 [Labilithrix sp.]|nr:hypothetical protein [Labilithrix sp.]